METVREYDAVSDYCEQVLSGKILTGELVKMACERHLNDLAASENEEYPYYFDPQAAADITEFCGFLPLHKGVWEHPFLRFELWQTFIAGCIFGWKRKRDGLRRFRTAYIEVPRKNGKSTFGAGIGLFATVADGEPGAEIYSAATTRQQAKAIFDTAKAMVKKSEWFKEVIQPLRENLLVEDTESFFRPLSSDADSLDGLNVHVALVDELHAHKTREVWDVLDSATGSRRQPLMFAITTAGFNQTGICYETREYSEQILRGVVQDDTFFAFISCPDKDDPWDDPKTWEKANPNFGVSVLPDDMERLAIKAKAVPAALNNFLTKRLNIWTQQADRWLDLRLWDQNNLDPVIAETLARRKCYGGLDLSSVLDLTAWVMIFPREEDSELVDVIARFWCPESRLYDDSNRYREQYQAWEKAGFLDTTPGDAIDYEYIKSQILVDAETFQIVDLNVDRLFQGYQLSMELQEQGLTIVPFGMGFTSMAGPSLELERRLMLKKVNHGGNPILRWMADNVSVAIDPAGNKKPNKKTSQGKIDGIVALLMALDRHMRHEPKKKESIYKTRRATVL